MIKNIFILLFSKKYLFLNKFINKKIKLGFFIKLIYKFRILIYPLK